MLRHSGSLIRGRLLSTAPPKIQSICVSRGGARDCGSIVYSGAQPGPWCLPGSSAVHRTLSSSAHNEDRLLPPPPPITFIEQTFHRVSYCN